MRLFLDQHLSGRRVADRLRASGHDVRAASEERELDGWSDHDLLSLATREERIMVTLDVGDFSRLAREWAGAGIHHAGCIILLGISQSEFGVIIRTIETTLGSRPDQMDWVDYIHLAGRHG